MFCKKADVDVHMYRKRAKTQIYVCPENGQRIRCTYVCSVKDQLRTLSEHRQRSMYVVYTYCRRVESI